MCYSSPEAPSNKPAPPPPPAPTIMPSEVSAQSTESAKQKRRESLRSGLASTIKTSARGITGAGPELISPSLLGSKTKLGG